LESLCYRDEAGHSLNTDYERSLFRSDAYKEQRKELLNIDPKEMTVSGYPKTVTLRGGNRKTRYKTKKYKKRCNTKTKKYKKHRK
jgi:hypothetical protein